MRKPVHRHEDANSMKAEITSLQGVALQASTYHYAWHMLGAFLLSTASAPITSGSLRGVWPGLPDPKEDILITR